MPPMYVIEPSLANSAHVFTTSPKPGWRRSVFSGWQPAVKAVKSDDMNLTPLFLSIYLPCFSQFSSFIWEAIKPSNAIIIPFPWYFSPNGRIESRLHSFHSHIACLPQFNSIFIPFMHTKSGSNKTRMVMYIQLFQDWFITWFRASNSTVLLH